MPEGPPTANRRLEPTATVPRLFGYHTSPNSPHSTFPTTNSPQFPPKSETSSNSPHSTFPTTNSPHFPPKSETSPNSPHSTFLTILSPFFPSHSSDWKSVRLTCQMPVRFESQQRNTNTVWKHCSRGVATRFGGMELSWRRRRCRKNSG